jgi:hypothetical protein
MLDEFWYDQGLDKDWQSQSESLRSLLNKMWAMAAQKVVCGAGRFES